MSSEHVHASVGARERLRALLHAPRLPIDLEALEWNDLAPGVRVHVLESTPAGEPKRALIWALPDAALPEHSHDVPEDTLVLEGTLELTGDGQGAYPEGTLFHSRTGTAHSARNIGDGRCLCYVVYWPVPPTDRPRGLSTR